MKSKLKKKKRIQSLSNTMQDDLGHRVCRVQRWDILCLTIKISREYAKHHCPGHCRYCLKLPVPYPSLYSLGCLLHLCSLCSYHFDMLRRFDATVSELGPASVPDLNFNSLKKHIVVCTELSDKIMNSEKDSRNVFL